MSETPARITRSQSRQTTPQPVPGGRSASRARGTAVPSLSVGQNFAYGASGKAVLRGQLAQETATLTSVLQTRRAASAIPEEDREGNQGVDGGRTPSPPPAVNPPLRHRQQAARAMAANSAASAPPADTTEMVRNPTVLDAASAYGDDDVPVAEPNPILVAAHTLPRFVPRAWADFIQDSLTYGDRALYYILMACFFLMVLGLGACAIKLCLFLLSLVFADMPVIGERFFVEMNRKFNVGPYSMPPHELQQAWLSFRSQDELHKILPHENMTQFKVDAIQSATLQQHEERIRKLEAQGKMHEDTLNLLKDMMPQWIAVREVNGRYEIPEQMWQAIYDKLTSSESATPLWNGFMQRNKENIAVMTGQIVDEKLYAELEHHQLVDVATLARSIEENRQWLRENMPVEFQKLARESTARLTSQVMDAAKDAVASTSSSLLAPEELKLFIEMTAVYNSMKAQRQVNYFAPGLGARINPSLTSSTWKKPQAHWYQFGATPHPPIAALQRWEETSDCWCAAPSNKMGKAQLAVQMSHTIYPDRLIVEHIPSEGTFNISTAPRMIEVWVERPKNSPNTADQLRQTVKEYQKFDYTCSTLPSKNYICIGAGKYDIHAISNHQAIPMFVDTKSFGLAVNKVTVRVTQNWGGEATCLYRLRLTGERAVIER